MDSAVTCRGCGHMKRLGDLCCPRCWSRLPRALRSRLTYAKRAGLVGTTGPLWVNPWSDALRSWERARAFNRRQAQLRAARRPARVRRAS